MRFFTSATTLASVAVLACTASAQCVTDQDATKVANNFASLFSAYTNSLADNILATGFTDQTDSVAWLINNGTNCPIPYGQPTFTSRAAFEAAQGSQPNLTFTVLNVYHDCSNVFIRWKFPFSGAPQPVQGISILGVVFNTGATFSQLSTYGFWLIQKLYTEFNSGAFAIDVGLIPNDRVSPAPCS